MVVIGMIAGRRRIPIPANRRRLRARRHCEAKRVLAEASQRRDVSRCRYGRYRPDEP